MGKIRHLSVFLSWMAWLIAIVPGVGHALETKTVSFPNVPTLPGEKADGITVSGGLIKPEGNGPFPAVVLLHTCGGIKETVTGFWSSYFADKGYVALWIDSFRARNLRPGRDCQILIPDAGPVTRDAHGALKFLASQPFVDRNRIGAIGFSLGAGIIARFVRLDVATPDNLKFKAVASLYGACSVAYPGSQKEEPFTARVPWLVVNGDQELAHFLQSCRDVKDMPGVEYHELAGAYHAWDEPAWAKVTKDGGGNPMLYSKEATAKSQQIVSAFFQEYLKN